ncbi:MAG: hypothetical protein IKJ91_05695 [Clostridia bacterium]|nr:hypothetical protein [Clostridia bacterium]
MKFNNLLKKSVVLCLTLILAVIFSVFAFAGNIFGDIQSDGKVDTKDAVVLAQYLAGWDINPGVDEYYAADVNFDGTVDTRDAVLLAQYLAQWNVTIGGIREKDEIIEDENMIYTKSQLMAVLNMAWETNGTIIGEGNSAKDANMMGIALEDFKNASGGELPGMVGLDIGSAFMEGYRRKGLLDEIVAQLADYAKQGGIIHTWAHMANPSPMPEDKTTWSHVWGKLGTHTEEDWQQLFTEGTEYNTKFKAALDDSAEFLKLLRDNGITAIWRPYHEHSGTWFWWCFGYKDAEGNRLDEKYFKQLWIYTYEYFTNEWGLDNLVWMYSPSTGNYAHQLYGYPGDEYVDIVGFDWYTSGKYEEQNLAYNRLLASGKSISLGEFGVTGDARAEDPANQSETWSCLDLLAYLEKAAEEGRRYSFWFNWSTPHQFSQLGHLDKLVESPLVYCLDDVKNMFDNLKGADNEFDAGGIVD